MSWDEFKNKAKKFSKEKLATASVFAETLSQSISQTDWFKGLNDFSSEVSKAMDKEYLEYLKGTATEKMSSINHRIMDGGHDFFSSIERAKEVGTQNGWTDMETFTEWAKAYFSDMSSVSGVPVFGKMSEHIYKLLKEFGISEKEAADWVTINGQEALESVVGGSIAAVAFVFAWKDKDKEAFSKSIGFILTSGAASLTPITIVVAIVAMAVGYKTLVCKEAVARGALSSLMIFSVSALIPGPVLLGLVPAVVLSIYISKKLGKDFKPIEFTKKMWSLTKDPQFKKDCAEVFGAFVESEKKAA